MLSADHLIKPMIYHRLTVAVAIVVLFGAFWKNGFDTFPLHLVSFVECVPQSSWVGTLQSNGTHPANHVLNSMLNWWWWSIVKPEYKDGWECLHRTGWTEVKYRVRNERAGNRFQNLVDSQGLSIRILSRTERLQQNIEADRNNSKQIGALATGLETLLFSDGPASLR